MSLTLDVPQAVDSLVWPCQKVDVDVDGKNHRRLYLLGGDEEVSAVVSVSDLLLFDVLLYFNSIDVYGNDVKVADLPKGWSVDPHHPVTIEKTN